MRILVPARAWKSALAVDRASNATWGSRLTYPASVEEKATIIGRLSPGDGKAWLEYAR